MRGPLPKGWLLDKDIAYGQPCANYKDTMKHKVDFITRFGEGALNGSEQSTRTESDHDYTQRVRDRVYKLPVGGRVDDDRNTVLVV